MQIKEGVIVRSWVLAADRIQTSAVGWPLGNAGDLAIPGGLGVKAACSLAQTGTEAEAPVKPQLARAEHPELLLSAVTEGISPYSAGWAQRRGGRKAGGGPRTLLPPPRHFTPTAHR